MCKHRHNPKPASSTPASTTDELNLSIAQKLYDALKLRGYSEPQLSLLMAQAAHETQGFTKTLAIENNNLGGVKYNKSLKDVATPSNDYLAPAKEDKLGRRMPYARFENLDDFINHWIGYSHLNQKVHDNKIAPPLCSDNLADYTHRLSLNHYYQDKEIVYWKGMTHWNKVLEKANLSKLLPAGMPATNTPAQKNSPLLPKGNLQPIISNADAITKPLAKTQNNLPGMPDLLSAHSNESQGMVFTMTVEEAQHLYDSPDTSNVIMMAASNQPDTHFTPSLASPALAYDLPFEKNSSQLEKLNLDNSIPGPFSEPLITLPGIDKPRGNVNSDFPSVERALQLSPRAANNQFDATKTVQINLNKPMIENLTINAQGSADSLDDFRQKVEEILLDTLREAPSK